MLEATLGRDTSYDGVFLVAVRTTGIFCRPSCPARKPRPENMEYFGRVNDALLAGYRPCKRCRPMDANGRPPAWVGQLMALVEEDPSRRLRDVDLRCASIDPTRARRYFTRHYGMTFQAYHRARRMGLALVQLRRGADLNATAVDSGFASCSGFRDAFGRIFGRPPGAGRKLNMVVTAQLESPLGPLVAAANEQGVCLLEFADRRALERQIQTLRRRLDCTILPGSNRHLARLSDELERYFAGQLREFSVPLVTPGTDFQEAVWARLKQIPFGQTLSYGQLATDLGRSGAQRAVGGANGDNRIAIVIPCHRVVQADGQLRGYGGGLWRKKYLLELEAGVPAAQWVCG